VSFCIHALYILLTCVAHKCISIKNMGVYVVYDDEFVARVDALLPLAVANGHDLVYLGYK
jgi:hypothetical protein